MNKYTLLFLLSLNYYALAATISTIKSIENYQDSTDIDSCSWPCPNESDICQISNFGVTSCQPLHDQQWIIPYPQAKPVFYVKDQSSLSKLYQSCEIAPVFSKFGDHPNNNHDEENQRGKNIISSGTCAQGLFCIQGQCLRENLSSPSMSHQHGLERRENGHTFSQSTEHTTAFNVIHVIAAVVGILGAAFVGVTVFIMCRRRKRLQKQHVSTTKQQLRHTTSTSSSRSASTASSSSSSSSSMPPPSPTIDKSMDRFNQFAQAYEDGHSNDGVLAVPPHVYSSKSGYNNADTSVSPSMQQMHLHTQLLYQAGVHRKNNNSLHQHHTSNSNNQYQQQTQQHEPSSSALLPPPPPYQP